MNVAVAPIVSVAQVVEHLGLDPDAAFAALAACAACALFAWLIFFDTEETPEEPPDRTGWGW